jgi:ubiquinone/menaquinone biosynthesis C-methylase UbiE
MHLADAWSRKRKVIRSYDSTATLYDARYAEEQEAKYKVAVANVKPKGAVLDVGCGSGLFFKFVSDKADCVVGVDSSRQLLLEARKRTLSAGNVHVVQSDADNLPFKARAFDVVYSFTVLQNMPQPMETLKELSRVAKPNAKLVLSWLKKIFSMETLCVMLEHVGLPPISIIDDASLKCYVAISHKSSK